MTRDDFIHQMTAEAVYFNQFPNHGQRVNYPNKWAVISLNGIPLVCCDTKENAETAARLWTISESQVGLFDSSLEARCRLVDGLR